MGGMNMLVSPLVWDYTGKWAPDNIKAGDLVSSYTIVSLSDYIFKLRPGVDFALNTQSAASELVNGRQLTAADVVFTYDRMCGLAGWTASGQENSTFDTLQSVTALDNLTVEFKFSAPSSAIFDAIMDPVTSNSILPQEVVSTYGNMNNWHNVVGSGPFMLTDYVADDSATYIANPNYYGYDVRHPANHLPYISKVNILIIPVAQTALAAVRTGKVDVMEQVTWDEEQSLKQTNPSLLWTNRTTTWYTTQERIDKAPFNDIRVREALTEAIDLPTIAKNYFDGSVPSTPADVMSTSMTGWYTPYTQWPASLQQAYTYNPTNAKALLAAAGYPNGFNTDLDLPNNQDPGLMEIYASYFAAIGVNVKLNIMDPTSFSNLETAFQYDAMIDANALGNETAPTRQVLDFYSQQFNNWSRVNSPAYDALVAQLDATTDVPTQESIMIQADMMELNNFWIVQGVQGIENDVHQPWFCGWHGEAFGYWSKVSWGYYWINESAIQ
jgi:peptide/nickel transport system substrate-binding protein